MRLSKPPLAPEEPRLTLRVLPSTDIEVVGNGYRMVCRSDGTLKSAQRKRWDYGNWGNAEVPQSVLRIARAMVMAHLVQRPPEARRA